MSFYNIFFIFPVSEEREILDENCGFLTREDFLKIYHYATREKYHFLFCMLKGQNTQPDSASPRPDSASP